MTSAGTRTLIEEARDYIHPDSAHALYLIGCLADALESSEAELVRLRSAVAGVEALAEESEHHARIWIARGPGTDYDIGRHVIASMRRLRSVLSGTKGEAQ